MDARRKAVPAPRLTNAEIVAKSMEIIGKENGIPKAAPSDIDSELFWMREACVNIARIRARFSKKTPSRRDWPQKQRCDCATNLVSR
jgi:hypothetical protein